MLIANNIFNPYFQSILPNEKIPFGDNSRAEPTKAVVLLLLTCCLLLLPLYESVIVLSFVVRYLGPF